jgi:YARHG domain
MHAKSPLLGSRLTAVAIGVLTAVGIVTPALADCYDLVGCDNKDSFSKHYGDYLGSIADGPNCDFLYMMRNRIYQQHGYCFSTARAISALGNAGCTTKNQAAVPLSNIERANIATIQRAESIRRCPG